MRSPHSHLRGSRPTPLRGFAQARPVRFVAVGVLNTAFSFLVFELLFALSDHAALCLAVSYVVGAIFNYFTTRRFVFADHHAPGIARYGLGYGIVLAINLGAQEAMRRAGVAPGYGQAILLPFMAALSYTVNRRVVFRNRRDV